MKIYGVVYQVRNKINGKIYIGQTIRTSKVRFYYHARSNYPIGMAIRKYGMESFEISILDEASSQDSLNEKEVFWIKKLKSKSQRGYNSTDGGEGSSGFKASNKTRKKISIATRGKNNPRWGVKVSDETKRRMSANPNIRSRGHLDKPHTEEAKAKMSIARYAANRPSVSFGPIIQERYAQNIRWKRNATREAV
jgi:group I intron endonuclease